MFGQRYGSDRSEDAAFVDRFNGIHGIVPFDAFTLARQEIEGLTGHRTTQWQLEIAIYCRRLTP
jgi:hypothetical protein